MRNSVFLICLIILGKLTLFSQTIDFESVDTTKIPLGLFSELIDKFHGNGNQKVVFLDYNKERNFILYGIEWTSKLEASKDLMIIEPTDNGLVRRLITAYNPDFEFQFKNNYLYLISNERIEIYNMNELSEPISVPYFMDYKLLSRLLCTNDKDYDCVRIELMDNEKIILKRRNKLTDKIVEDYYFIENGKIKKI